MRHYFPHITRIPPGGELFIRCKSRKMREAVRHRVAYQKKKGLPLMQKHTDAGVWVFNMGGEA